MNLLLALWRAVPRRPRCRPGRHLALCRALAPRMGWACGTDDF
jgi:hypothetical protein